MNRKFLVSAVAICALGSAGIAFAEGTSGHKEQEKTQQQQQQQQTQQQTGTDVQPQTGSQTQEQAGAQTEQQTKEPTAEHKEMKKRGVARLDSVRLKSLDEASATKLQQKLADLGYYTAEVDGKFGAKSKAALTQFFRDQSKLIAQGRVSEIAMTALGLEDSEIERVRGVDQGGEETERAPMRGTEGTEGTRKVEPSTEPEQREDMP